MVKNQERVEKNHERLSSPDRDLEVIADKRREAMSRNFEKAERSQEERLEDAKHEVESVIQKHEKDTHIHEKETAREKSKLQKSGHGKISKKQKDATYKRTLGTMQAELPTTSRLFSKFIHNKVVEKTSDTVGSTIARPNAILSGSVFAFVFTLAIFLIARHYGYPLSGAETIAGFVVGWATGILFDYLRLMISGKPS